MDDSKLNLPYFNNTNYPLALKNQLAKIPYTDEISKKLRFLQHIPKEFFTRTENVRGMLVALEMGQGKTRLAAAISQFFRDMDPQRKVIVLLAKSLEDNFRNNITSYTGKDDSYIDKNYKFISLNSSRMFKKISNVDKTSDEEKYEQRLGKFMDDIIKRNALENSLLIIDEAHNLFNGITNGAKNALALYDLIMKTRNIKLLFLTGTPIINDPFELVPCFNMARGPMKLIAGSNETNIGDVDNKSNDVDNELNNGITGGGRFMKRNKNDSNKSAIPTSTLLFSESYEEFHNYFVDTENKRIKNKTKFTNRIFGLTSYYGELYFPDTKNKPGFPKELPTIVEKVEMGREQFTRYLSARESELEETSKSYRGQNARFAASQGGNSTYRVKSRQISNYCIPEVALGPHRGQRSREKFINKIPTDALVNLDKWSPKMQKILLNLEKHKNQKGIIYSQFVSGEGLAVLSKILEEHNYRNFATSIVGVDDAIKDKHNGYFAIVSGSITPEDRADIIKRYNTIGGDQEIRLLLLSGAVAEGIDLKRTRHVHIMEPFWNYARINQIKTRAIRYESHKDLPLEEQNVQVYIYLSDYPKSYPKDKIKEKTTDVELYEKSIDNMEIINSFMVALAESSIDCSLHYDSLPDSVKKRINCKMCSPDNSQLFHPLISRDMTLPSNCKQFQEAKVQVQEISIPDTDEKFYYKQDGADIKLFSFDKKLNGYTAMPRSHRFYGQVMEHVIEKSG